MKSQFAYLRQCYTDGYYYENYDVIQNISEEDEGDDLSNEKTQANQRSEEVNDDNNRILQLWSSLCMICRHVLEV